MPRAIRQFNRFSGLPSALRCGRGSLHRVALSALTTLAFIGLFSGTAQAGGGPENVFLVVNPFSASSLAVANQYIALRNIPPTNVMYLRYTGALDSMSVEAFRTEILTPVLDAISNRSLPAQIDYVVYSTDFPYAIDFTLDLPAEQRTSDTYSSGSLTGMTYLALPVLAKRTLAYVGLDSNKYFRPAKPDRGVAATHAFRSWYGWGQNGETLEAGGSRYMLSTMLGFIGSRGNTQSEILAYLKRNVPADGTRPPGTIYYMQNDNVRSTTRDPLFPQAVDQLKQLGVSAQILPGEIPVRRPNIAGCQTGTRVFNWGDSRNIILPGAICDNLTSFSGMMMGHHDQTPLSVFLRYGAAGSSGTVVEPGGRVLSKGDLNQKFPSPLIQVHYARGCSLAESFYQSVNGPYQLLIIGDPLCQPWAEFPTIASTGLKAGDNVSGKLSIHPSGTSRTGSVDRFELYLDGLRVAQCGVGGSLDYDTATLPDGYHDVRVVGITANLIETQGHQYLWMMVNNRQRQMTLAATRKEVSLGQPLELAFNAPGATGVMIYRNNSTLTTVGGAQGRAQIDTRLLGEGLVQVQAIGLATNKQDLVLAKPIWVTVQPALGAR